MMALRMMLRAPGMLIGAIIMAFLMDRELAAVFLIVLPVMTVVILLLLRIAYPRFEFMQKKLDALNSNIQEVLTNVRVIKSFVREDYESARFEKSNAELKESSLNAFKIAVAQMPLMMLFMNLTTLVVVWLGGNQILGGKMQVGDLTAFTTYIVQVLMSLMMLAMVFLQSSRAFASGRRINEVMDTKVSLTDDPCSISGSSCKKRKDRIPECFLPILQRQCRKSAGSDQSDDRAGTDDRYHRIDGLRQNNAGVHDSASVRCG